jgi:hypothetical protein
MSCKYKLFGASKREYFRVMFTESHEVFDEMTDHGNSCHRSILVLTNGLNLGNIYCHSGNNLLFPRLLSQKS